MRPFKAVRRAGDANIETLSNFAKFFQTAAPVGCDGSPERVNSWQERYDIVEFKRSSSHSVRNGLQMPVH